MTTQRQRTDGLTRGSPHGAGAAWAVALALAIPPGHAAAAGPDRPAPVPPVSAVRQVGAREREAPPPDRAWPVAGPGGRDRPVVLRGFEPPPLPWSAGHRGVDLAARPGTPVVSATPGRVVFAGPVAGRGVVTVEITGTGTPPLRTTYEPVQPSVTTGDTVEAGARVGTLQPGPFHCPTGCLHWGLLRGDQYLDPLSLMPPQSRRHGPSRLLPIFGVPAPQAPLPPAPAPMAAAIAGAALLTATGRPRPRPGLRSRAASSLAPDGGGTRLLERIYRAR